MDATIYTMTGGADLSTSLEATYAASLDAIVPGTTATLDSQAQPGESWSDTLQRLLPTLATTYQQAQLLQVQVDRAKAGLPPLDVSQYAAGVNVGLSSDTQRLVMWGGLAMLGLAAFAIANNRRR